MPTLTARHLRQAEPLLTVHSSPSFVCTAGFDDPARDMVERSPTDTHHLFAYPLESNFSGARYPLSLTTTVQTGQNMVVGDQMTSREDLNGAAPGSEVAGDSRRWWVLLDAAKACGTSPPDLSVHKPDFVVSLALQFGNQWVHLEAWPRGEAT